jgi:chromosome partitioning protein
VRTIAIINQKGGVGKTTSVANLGAAIAARGHKVLLVDMDPQSHLTLHLGVEPGASASMYDVMVGDTGLAAAAVEARPNLSIVPAVIDLAAAEVELVTTVGREQILRDKLNATPLPYEFVLIDCPPSLGLLTLNALAASQDVLIPLQPHFLALQGLGKLLETVALVQRRINPALKVSGVLLCMYETGTRLAGEVLTDLRNFFELSTTAAVPWSAARIFKTPIRRNVKLAESPSHGKTIFDYEPSSNGAADYAAMAEEFLSCFAGNGQAVATAASVAPAAPAATTTSAASAAPAPAAPASDASTAAGTPTVAPAPSPSQA